MTTATAVAAPPSPPAVGISTTIVEPGHAAASAETLLAVRLNGVTRDEVVPVLMTSAPNGLALRCDDWDALRLARRAPSRDWTLDGRCWRPMESLATLQWRVDEATQTLVIDAPAAAFAGNRVELRPASAAVTPATRSGAFANYDVQWQRSAGSAGETGHDATRALLELGTFGPLGAGRVSGLVRDDGPAPRVVRLDSTWTHDVGDQMASLRLGDAIGRAGAWGRALRFGGVQWATDFSIQPGFLTFPLPVARGEAALPSTVDVYVNNSRRLQSNVPAGPFELTDLPVVTGSGQVRVVVRDLLGREQVIVQPYYGSPALLRPGLRSFSYEIGAARTDYGLASGHYGPVMAGATERLGVSDTFTREWRAELLGRQATAGATGIWQLGDFGVGSLSAVASHATDAGSGALGAATLDYQGTQWNGGLQLRQATRHFAQAGQGADRANRLEATLSVGGVIAGASIGASVVEQRPWQGDRQRLASATLSHAIGGNAGLSLFVLRDLVGRATTIALNLSIALDGRTSASLGSTRTRERSGSNGNTVVQVQRGIPEDRGFGYNLVGEAGDGGRVTAQGTQLTDVAEFSAGVALRPNATRSGANGADWRAGVAGGVAWLDDSVFMSRRIDGSFAVVEVGGYAGVQVLHDQRPVARTDAHGRALVPGLRGYDVNRIGIDAAGLPLDAEVDALEVELTPPARSGVVLSLPVRRNRSASLRLVDAAGIAVPPGSVVEFDAPARQFAVGFEGRAFVSGLAAHTPIVVRWPGGQCSAVLTLAADAGDAPDLGRVRCQ